jgi:hypothetical protein
MLPCASVHASGHCGAGDRILYSISSMNRTTCSQMHECWRVPGTRAPSQRRRMLRIPNESEDISESVQFCVASRSTSAAYPRVHPSRRYSGMSYSDEPGCTSRLVTLLTILADTSRRYSGMSYSDEPGCTSRLVTLLTILADTSRRYSGMSYSDEPGCTSRLVTLLTILADTSRRYSGMSYSDEPGCTSRLVTLLTILADTSRRYSGMSYSDEPGCTSRLVTLLTRLADTAVQHASGSPHMICPLEQGSLAGKHRLVSALRLLLEGAPPWPKRTSCGSPIPRIAPCYRVSGPAPLSGPPLTSRRFSRTGFELHTRCFPKRFSNEFRRRRVSRCVFACDCHQK